MIPPLLPYALALVALVGWYRSIDQRDTAAQERDEADRLLEREMEITHALRRENTQLRRQLWQVSHATPMDINQIVGTVIDL